jgi:hypothetical protein
MNIESQLSEVLRYEPKTGFLFWTDRAHKSVKNKQAGTPNHRGYIIVLFRGKPYKAHRLAWLLTHGYWPSQMIDHIDGNKSNNRINNLRDVDGATNEQNKDQARSDSKSGLIGASPYRNRWKSQIRVNGAVKYLGVFDTAEMAHQVYLQAKKQHHAGWARSEKNGGAA